MGHKFICQKVKIDALRTIAYLWKGKYTTRTMRRVIQKSKRDTLTAYAGWWVALRGLRVIESAPTLARLMRILEAKKLRDKVSVMLVPRKNEGPYILSF